MSNTQSQSTSTSSAADKAKAAAQTAAQAGKTVATAARTLKTYSGMSINKFIAVSIWLVGAYLTSGALNQLGVPEPFNVIIGAGLQLALTRAEAPLWSGRGLPKMGIAAMIVDVGVNSAGAWPYAKNIGNTDFWAMIRDITSDPNLVANIGTQLSFAILIGAFCAAAVEYFWSEG